MYARGIIAKQSVQSKRVLDYFLHFLMHTASPHLSRYCLRRLRAAVLEPFPCDVGGVYCPWYCCGYGWCCCCGYTKPMGAPCWAIGWEVCLAWGRDDGATLHHVHDDIGSQLLSVLGNAAAVSAVGIHAGPDEEYEVHQEGDELAHGRGEIEVVPLVPCVPEIVDVSILLRARREGGSFQSRSFDLSCCCSYCYSWRTVSRPMCRC